MERMHILTAPTDRDRMAQLVAERMRVARSLAGMTQEDAARALDVTVRTYARWERAETQGFLGELRRIAEAFETTPEELLGEVSADGGTNVAEELAALRAEVAGLRQLVEERLPAPKRRRG
jgi:transcriptional regulator with XRE-family HTH domain